MAYVIVTPNATQSPALFPAQNNENFRRLKDIINNDHNFTDSSAADQGIHKQVTYINRDTPGSLPTGNGITYTKVDDQGVTQLRWYNGTDYQITGVPQVLSAGVVDLDTSGIVGSTDPLYVVPANSFGYIYFWKITGVQPTGILFWISNATNVTCQQVATYTGSTAQSSDAAIPVTHNPILPTPLGLRPRTSSSTYNGTYNYRIFQVV